MVKSGKKVLEPRERIHSYRNGILFVQSAVSMITSDLERRRWPEIEEWESCSGWEGFDS